MENEILRLVREIQVAEERLKDVIRDGYDRLVDRYKEEISRKMELIKILKG